MHKAGAVVVGLLGARTLYLYVQQVRGLAPRYQVEAAALLFVLAGMLLVLAAGRDRRAANQATQISMSPGQAQVWVVFVVAALGLYWPTIGIGLLSDDFVLWDTASAWRLGPVTPSLFRPLPLLVWAGLIAAGATPTVLHVLNIVLHGTNGYLASRLCQGWVPGAGPALLAGALMVVFPLASEPVSWPSGVFDLAATALTLVFVLRGRVYAGPVTTGQRALFVGAGILALTAKETSAIAGLLVLTDAWIRRSLNHRLLLDTGIVLTIAAAFSAIRLLGAFGFTSPSITKYRVQRALFESFGGLSVPFSAGVTQVWPWLAILGGLIVISLAAGYFTHTGRRSDRFALGAGVWILISILPVFPFVFVGPDLQGARFLYLAAAGFVSLIAALSVSADSARARRLGVTAGISLAVLWAAAAIAHQQPWRDAASVRDRVMERAKTNVLMQQCQTVRIARLPDAVQGAYVFRNGAPEALLRDTGLRVREDAPPQCRFEWSESAAAFIRAPE